MNICYCGHPRSSHMYSEQVNHEGRNCYHCLCIAYAEKPATQETEEKPRWNTERSVRDIIRDEPTKPQDEPKCCGKCIRISREDDGSVDEIWCNDKSCPCHQESETEFNESVTHLAIAHLKVLLPLAKGYAKYSNVGSNRKYVQRADEFLKSLEK